MTSGETAQPAGAAQPRPRFWAKLPVAAGNLVQLAGVVVGVLLIVAAGATRGTAALSVFLAVIGILAVYLCCHAIAHWLVGRLVGLRFAYVGCR